MSTRRIIVLIVLVIALTLVGLGLANQNSLLAFALATGVLGSVLANFLWALFNTKEMGAENKLLDRLTRLTESLEARNTAGLMFLGEKFADKPQYWANRANGTNTKFLMIGYSLSTAFSPEFRTHTLAALDRVARNKGDVCWIILDPAGAAHGTLANARSRSFASATEETLVAVRQFRGSLPAALRQHVEVRLLPPSEAPTYWALITDQSVEFAPYLLRETTARAFHSSFLPNSSFGRLIDSDFSRIRAASVPLDLN